MRNKGVTLVALIVTIIIMLILAGVTISVLFGENGILSTAKSAREETIKTQGEEEIVLGIQVLQIENKGEVSLENIRDNIQKEVPKITEVSDIENDELEIEHENGYTYIINRSLKIEATKKTIQIAFNPNGKVGVQEAVTKVTITKLKGEADKTGIYYKWTNSSDKPGENDGDWILLNALEAEEITSSGKEFRKTIPNGNMEQYYLCIKAYDKESPRNCFIKKSELFCDLDTKAPVATITMGTKTLGSQIININVTEDKTGITEVTLEKPNGDKQTTNVSNKLSYTQAYTATKNGIYKVSAKDAAGNETARVQAEVKDLSLSEISINIDKTDILTAKATVQLGLAGEDITVSSSKYIWNTSSAPIGVNSAEWMGANTFHAMSQTLTYVNEENVSTYFLHVLRYSEEYGLKEKVSDEIKLGGYYLYNYGDEFTSRTGNWNFHSYNYSPTYRKNSDSLEMIRKRRCCMLFLYHE